MGRGWNQADLVRLAGEGTALSRCQWEVVKEEMGGRESGVSEGI